MPLLLRIDRKRQVCFGERLVGYEGNIDRSRITDRLRQQTNLIVKVWARAEPSVPPRGVVRAGACRDARLIFQSKAAVHRSADYIEDRNQHWIQKVSKRIAERWRKHDGARGSRLVVVVDDLRKPLPEQHLVYRVGFRESGHVEISIVVV